MSEGVSGGGDVSDGGDRGSGGSLLSTFSSDGLLSGLFLSPLPVNLLLLLTVLHEPLD